MASSQDMFQWSRLLALLVTLLIAQAAPGCALYIPSATVVWAQPTDTPAGRAATPETPTPRHATASAEDPGPTLTLPPTQTTPIATRQMSIPSQTPAFPAKAIQLAWFYKPPINGDLNTLANFFDFFILTKKDEPARDQLKAAGVRLPILQYLLLFEIQNPGSCSREPFGNQVAYLAGDFCSLRQDHPDWFLADLNGKPIVEGKTVYMDPGNPEYRAFWLERARRTQEELGWQGVFIDNIEASLSGRRNQGIIPARYADNASGEASYTAAIAGFLEYVSLNYFRPQGRPLWGNITVLEDADVFFRYLNYLDGVMIENFAVDWSDRYRTPEEWDRQLAIAERTQDLGKSVILVAQGRKLDKNRQLFALASYLLVNQGRAYFRYSDSQLYNEIWIYDNYSVDLGAPLGRRYQNGSFYQRDFSKGTVTVDPALHTAKIEVKP